MYLIDQITENGHKAIDRLRACEYESIESLLTELCKARDVEDLTFRSVLAIERTLRELGLEPNVFFCFHDESEDNNWENDWWDDEDEDWDSEFGMLHFAAAL